MDVLLISWLQGRTPRAMMGRVMSLMMIAEVGMLPVSITVSGALIKLSLERVFMGAGSLIVAFCLVVGLRRDIREMAMAEDSSQ